MSRYNYICLIICLIFILSTLFVAAHEGTYPPDYYEEYDYNTYQEFYQSADIEKITTFIPYSYYERLGRLEKVTLTHLGTTVRYEIVDQNGFHLYVSTGGGCTSPKGQQLSENVSEDLRHLAGPNNDIEKFWHPTYIGLVHPDACPCICSENASYFYESDGDFELKSIAIRLSTDPEHEDYHSFINISWSSDNAMLLSEYPLDNDNPSYFARLLKAETADDAIAEIRDMANGKYAKEARNRTIIISSAIGAGVIAIALPVAVVAVRRKKKKAAAGAGGIYR